MPWAFGREVGKVNTGVSATSQAVTLTAGASVPVGNVVVVWAGNNGGNINTGGITDSAGNVWHLEVNNNQGFLIGLAMAWCVLTNPWTNASTITSNCSVGGALIQELYVADFTPPGSGAVSLDKKANAGAASSSTYSSGATATTTGSDDLLIGGVRSDGGTAFTPGAQVPSWTATTTEPLTQSGEPMGMYFARDAGSGAYTFTGSITAGPADSYAGIIALQVAASASTAAAAPVSFRLPLSRGLHDPRTMWLYQPLPAPVAAAAPPAPPAPLTPPVSSTLRLSVLRGLRNLAGMRAFQPGAQRYLVDAQSGTLIFGGSAAESVVLPPLTPPVSDVTRLSVLRGIRNPAGMRRYQPAALKYTVDTQSGALVFGGSAVSSTTRVDSQSGNLIFGGSSSESFTSPAAAAPLSNVTQLSVTRGIRNPVGMRRYQPAALKYTTDAQTGTLVFAGSATESVVVPAPPAPVSNTTRLSVLRGIRSPQGMRAFQPAALSYRVDAQSGTLLFAGSSSEAFTPPPAPAPLSDVTRLSVSRGIRNLAGMRRYQPAQVTYRTDSQTGNLIFGGSATSSTGRVDAQSGNLIFTGSGLEYWTPPTPVPPLSNVTQLSVTRGVRNTVGMRRYQPAALTYRLDARTGNLIFAGSGTDTYLPPGGPASPFTPTVGIAAFIKVGTN